MSTLLDAKVLSELLRVQPDPSVLAWFPIQPSDSLFVSAVTQAEMMPGARLVPKGKRRQLLEQSLDEMFRDEFAGLVLRLDATAAPEYAAVVTVRRSAGRPISQFDARIAAIALSRRLALATRNLSDFEGCGLVVIDPWKHVQ